MEKKIIILGCGPGASDLITLRGQKALEKAGVIVGAKRLLDKFHKNLDASLLVLENNYKEILDEVEKISKSKEVLFLVSGDPLFNSFGISIIKRFGENRCNVIPGISSFQYAFCRLKMKWDEFKTFSLHGKTDLNLDTLFRENRKFILLLDPKHNLKYIKSELKTMPPDESRFYIASNLSLDNENIECIDFEDFDNYTEESLSILIVDGGDTYCEI